MLLSPIAVVVIFAWLFAFGITMAIKRTPAALAMGMLSGLLFLPQFSVPVLGLALNKDVVLCLATGAAAFLVGHSYRSPFRMTLFELPVIGLCAAGMLSSYSNGLSVYYGSSLLLSSVVSYVIPWFVGKAVFSSHPNAIVLVRMTIIAGIVYIPFCLLEMKIAPVLHEMVYGYTPRGVNDMLHAIRFGLWRPTVFMTIGLQLALFMGIVSVLAFWGHQSGGVQRIGRVPILWIAVLLGMTTLMCVSTGAILITMLGWCVVFAFRVNAGRILLLAVAIVPIAYPVYRMNNIGAVVSEVVEEESLLSDRQASLNFRIRSEDMFLARWKERPFLGATSGGFRDAGETTICDSQWIAFLGCNGLFGWVCWSLVMFLPTFASVTKDRLQRPDQNVAVVLALCVLMSWLDCLSNAFPIGLYLVMAGAATSLDISKGVLSASPGPRCDAPRRVRLQRTAWPPPAIST